MIGLSLLPKAEPVSLLCCSASRCLIPFISCSYHYRYSTMTSVCYPKLSPYSLHPPNPAPLPPRKALKSRPQIRSSKIQPIRHPWCSIVPSLLCRDSSRPFSPSSLFTSDRNLAALPIASTTPCPVHSLLPATSADGCTLQGDAPGLKLLPRRSFSALSKRPSLPVKYAEVWSADRLKRRRGHPSLTRHPSAAFHLRVLVKMKTRILPPLLNLPASSVQSKRLCVEQRIRVVVSSTPYLRHDR